VIDGAGRLVVHRRADWKDVWPGRWDLAFGGLVGVGEDWATAAARELAEEAGVSARLAEVAAGAYDDDEVAVLGRVYLARHDGPFTFADGEVVEDDRVPVADVPAWLEGRAVCPDSVALVAPVVAALAAARPTVTRVQAPWEDR
jgi:8-oxo-dGTP pyrophosphatase MutT (NUDIX family)